VDPEVTMQRVLSIVLLTSVCFAASPAAQWLQFETPGVPRTADRKPNLNAPAPRTADRRPDLSGVWKHVPTSVDEMKRLFGAQVEEAIKVDVPGMEIGTQNKYAIDLLLDFRGPDSPMRPATADAFIKKLAAPPHIDDVCDPGSVVPFPLAGLLSEPIKIVQAPRLTLVLYEVGNSHRQIYTDGRALPREINLPAYLGYSIGRWEGDTFVVETIGFNDKQPLDVLGHPRSERLRITERFRRRDFGHMDVEMTFNDPVHYTRPFTISVPHTLLADQDIFEMYPENEKDCARIAAVSGSEPPKSMDSRPAR
jgi:hypothetical protein